MDLRHPMLFKLLGIDVPTGYYGAGHDECHKIVTKTSTPKARAPRRRGRSSTQPDACGIDPDRPLSALDSPGLFPNHAELMAIIGLGPHPSALA